MKKIFTIIATVAVLSLSSCKDYLDINHSPNSPGEELATMDMARKRATFRATLTWVEPK